ncbi:MAG: hypothetical protein NTV49_12300 [Kiritimatiellaeota bacterium]|nr:hypothetical protein [Kiritimatiellota bacterium]
MLRTLTVGAALLTAASTTPAAAGLTPEQTSAAQKIVVGKCAECHTLGKAVKKDPAQMQAHMKKKAKLSDQELQLVVPFLTAQRNGGTNLTSKAIASPDAAAAGRKHGQRKHKEEDHE